MTLVDIRSATITQKGQISIPKKVREKKGFKTGSKIVILSFDDHVELRPMEQVRKRMYTAMVSEKALAKDWMLKDEDAVWKGL